jgi:hypothetical protein
MKIIDDILSCNSSVRLNQIQCFSQGVTYPSSLVKLENGVQAVIEKGPPDRYLIHVATQAFVKDHDYPLLLNLQSVSPRSGVFESGALHIDLNGYEGIAIGKGGMHVIAIKSTH